MLPAVTYNPPAHTRLDILYKDTQLIIINKPPGLLSVPGRGIEKQDCLLSRVQADYPDALSVHRLDMPTSGIIIFALNKQTQRYLGIQFEKKQIKKQYIAVVQGELKEAKGRINQPLITDWHNRPKQKIDYSTGKPSITDYELISIDENGNSIVKLMPITGRSHQLRVHMLSIGHPILGDQLYATDLSDNACERLLLHAEKISFIHPETNTLLEIICAADFI